MSFWRKLFGANNPAESDRRSSKSSGDAKPSSPANMMMTPKALAELIHLHVVSAESIAHHCTYREFRGTVWHCQEPALVICGTCGGGRCLDAHHVYTGFCTLRDSTPFDATGSKFFYYCQTCSDFICVNCLGIADDYPCPPAELESYQFRCPKCGGLAHVVRADGVDYAGIVDVLASYPSSMLRFSSAG